MYERMWWGNSKNILCDLELHDFREKMKIKLLKNDQIFLNLIGINVNIFLLKLSLPITNFNSYQLLYLSKGYILFITKLIGSSPNFNCEILKYKKII